MFSIGLDLLLRCPESFTFPLAPLRVLSTDGSRASLASTPTCSLGSHPCPSAYSPACWGTVQKTRHWRSRVFLPLTSLGVLPGREGGKEGGKERGREGLLTGSTAALPLEGASPCSYPERHHQN